MSHRQGGSEMENSETRGTKENGGQKAPLNLVNSSKQSGDSASGAATAAARSVYDQAKETAGHAYEAVTEKAADKLDRQRSTLSGGLSAVADSVRQVSSNLGSSTTESGLAEKAAKYTDTAARKIENVADYFDRKTVRDMASDLEGFARRNPAVFIGAAFGAGLLVARFLKSTTPDRQAGAAGKDFNSAEMDNRTADKSVSTSSDFAARPL